MTWQLTLTVLCIAAAIWFLARRLRDFVRSKSPGSCGSSGCGSCPTSEADSNLGHSKPFVSIDTLGAPKSPTENPHTIER